MVGGGYTGLWTALHAAQRNPDQRIVLIEGNRIGWAASGRNGGFVDASLTHGRENGKSRWPNEIDKLNAMGMENLDGMQADIERLGLDTEWQRTGMLSVATEPHQVDWLQHAAAGGEGRLLDLKEVREEVHSPTYRAGLFDADTTAIVHPAKLAFELARACTDAGVHIYEHTKANSLDSGGTALRVDTGAAVITCRQTVLATNVFASLLRRNRLHTVPVYDYVLATEALTDPQLDRIGWLNRQGIGDCGNQFHYYRLTMDNRIAWGGYDAVYHFGRKVNAAYEDRSVTYRRLAAHFFITFPQLDDVRFSHRWAGAIDTNTRFCAHWGWPATVGSPTSTGSPNSASVRRGSPRTCVWISWKVWQPHAPSWRWCASVRCRLRPSRWRASVFKRRGGRWIAPTTPPDAGICCCACWMHSGWASIPDLHLAKARCQRSAPLAGLTQAAVVPPGPRGRAVGVVDHRDERVEQARIMAATVELAQPAEQLLARLPAEVFRQLDT